MTWFFRVPRLLAVGLVLVCGACSHPIVIAPDLSQLPRQDGASKVDKKVGLHIPRDKRELRVKTPGGGGDNVDYTPYADLEPGLYRTLSNVFSLVVMVDDPHNSERLKMDGITYVFTPAITTTSSSRNIMFWPPTDFSVTIACTATDSGASVVWSSSVAGDGGLIPVSDILKDFGLAGRRASANSLLRLESEIRAASIFRK
ncbi:MAG TPA: hypothetical protein VK196_16220 [Magnetospirillum sp.]|nr:hypothetical protein [Magnetospirillum sp.]